MPPYMVYVTFEPTFRVSICYWSRSEILAKKIYSWILGEIQKKYSKEGEAINNEMILLQSVPLILALKILIIEFHSLKYE